MKISIVNFNLTLQFMFLIYELHQGTSPPPNLFAISNFLKFLRKYCALFDQSRVSKLNHHLNLLKYILVQILHFNFRTSQMQLSFSLNYFGFNYTSSMLSYPEVFLMLDLQI